MKAKDLLKILVRNNFKLVRSNGHKIYSNGNTTIAVPHGHEHSKGLTRRILQQANLKHEINF